jgi:hypothetical protein
LTDSSGTSLTTACSGITGAGAQVLFPKSDKNERQPSFFGFSMHCIASLLVYEGGGDTPLLLIILYIINI